MQVINSLNKVSEVWTEMEAKQAIAFFLKLILSPFNSLMNNFCNSAWSFDKIEPKRFNISSKMSRESLLISSSED